MSICLSRSECHNAFDDDLLRHLFNAFKQAEEDPSVLAIVLKAEGKHFCAGADLHWMKRIAHFTEAENYQDSLLLANTMAAIYQNCKPTIAIVQGSAYGGGAGLVAACDIAIAEEHARFCFSEVRLGLIPAVISPYIIEAIGARAAKYLFMSAEAFDAKRALQLGLIHHCVPLSELYLTSESIAHQITQNAPFAVRDCKQLVKDIQGKTIDNNLQALTAMCIAKKRVSAEGQRGLQAFINKQTIDWTQDI